MTGTLGFLAPMPSELKPLQKALSLQAEGEGLAAVHTATLDGRPVVAMMTGIGMPLAAERTRQMLAHPGVEHVIVIGIAGGLAHDRGMGIGTLVIPEVVVDLTDGRELRPTGIGSTPPEGRLVTGDFTSDLDELAKMRDDGAIAVDMETAAIGRLCEDAGRPWSVFRSISDDAFDPAINDDVLALSRPDGSADMKAVARYVAGDPRRVALLSRMNRDMKVATNVAVDAALRACREDASS
jgi:adenosylhomocysteine nucleosidase